MKKLFFCLPLIFLITLFTFNLSAQLTINLVSVENAQIDCLEANIELNLNDDVTLVEGENCEYATDFSNVKIGNNELSISSDKLLYEEVSTFDMVLLVQALLSINELSSYAQAIAADVDNDRVISTDDLVLLRQLILFEVTEIEEAVKIGSTDLLTESFEGFELRSNFTTYMFDKEDVEDGVNKDLLIIRVGDLDQQ
jgi:hypothetical protein